MKPRDILIYRGDSMSGTFLSGDLLHVASVRIHAIRPGDVVVYRSRGVKGPACRVVHRAVRTVPDGIVVRGDVNPREDMDLVTPENLVGRVASFKRNGAVRSVAGGSRGLRHAARARMLRRLKSLVKEHLPQLSRWIIGWRNARTRTAGA